MLFVFITLLFVSFTLLELFVKPKCPDCCGKMDDVGLHDGHIVYKCRDCGEEWI